MRKHPGSSGGGRKAGRAQRVRSAELRQGMQRRSAGSGRSARTSDVLAVHVGRTDLRGDLRPGGAGRSPDDAGLARLDQQGEGRGELARAGACSRR